MRRSSPQTLTHAGVGTSDGPLSPTPNLFSGKIDEASAPAAHAAASHQLLVSGVFKSFPGAGVVLGGVGFEVEGGEFVTLLGPSGCGKTTLLRIIAGLEVADAGTVALGGAVINEVPAHRRPVNTVFQSYALFPHLSVFENVAFGLRSRGVTSREISIRVQGAMELLRIEGFMERYPHQLSGGQRQRVALARALVNEPSVLLLDEPMSALDAKLRSEVQVELRRLQQRLGRTFVLVTHDQDEAMTVSDRILVMREGRIEQSGRPHEVYEKPRTRFVAEFLGAANVIQGRGVGEEAHTAVGPLSLVRPASSVDLTLAIRPERIRIVAQPPGRNAVRAVVKEVIYRGAHQELTVEPGPLRVHCPGSPRVEVGDRLWLELPPEEIQLLAE